MPDFATHACVGALAGGSANAISSFRTVGKIDGNSIFFGILGGVAGGVLADILDPATSPNHRGFFHAIMPTAFVYVKTDFSAVEDLRLQAFFRGLLYGYLSHLVLDARTRKGLPFWGIDIPKLSQVTTSTN